MRAAMLMVCTALLGTPVQAQRYTGTYRGESGDGSVMSPGDAAAH